MAHGASDHGAPYPIETLLVHVGFSGYTHIIGFQKMLQYVILRAFHTGFMKSTKEQLAHVHSSTEYIVVHKLRRAPKNVEPFVREQPQ